MAAQEITDDPTAAPPLPADISSALTGWAQQVAEQAAAPLRARLEQLQDELDTLRRAHAQVQAALSEGEASLERLAVEMRSARDIASNALVGKAKDQLAIEGKDAQLAELRRQLERQVAISAAESDARLAAEMERVGATTARDNLAAEVAELRGRLEARTRSLVPG